MRDEFWGGPVDLFSDESGELAVGSPAPGLLCTRASGRASPAMAAFLVATSRGVVAKAGSLEGFHEWSGMVGYESEARRILTDWGRNHGGKIKRAHYHVSGLLIQMGMSMSAAVLKHLVSHRSRDSLISAYERALHDAERSQETG